jgi:voltage-gated potassium channel
VDERSRRIAKRFEIPLLIGAALVIPLLFLEERTVREPWRGIAETVDWIVWLGFLAEVVVMVAVVPHRRRWLRDHPLDIAIVVLTPPFFSAALQGARVLRLLRLFRLVQLGRNVFSLHGLRFAAASALVTILAGGALFGSIEHRSTWDGVWWCVTTMTTLGSNIQPTTTAGRILAIFVVLVGISFVAILTGAVARRFLSEEIEQVAEEVIEVEQAEADLVGQVREITERLRRLEEDLARRVGRETRNRSRDPG